MTTRRRGQNSFRRTTRRREPTMWTTAALLNQNTAASGQVGIDILGGFTLTEKHNISGLVTIHYRFMYRSNTQAANTDGAFGVSVVEDDALAAAQFPEPLSDGDASWPVHHFFQHEQASADTKTIEGQSKARRRIPIKQSIAFVLDISSAGSVQWGIQLRVLLQRGR